MIMKIPNSLSAVILALAVPSASVAREYDKPLAGAAETCDRSCLLRIAEQFAEALTDNDVSRLPLSAGVRMTSNGADMAVGRGEAWGSPRRLPFRRVFVDPVTGAVAIYAVVSEVDPASFVRQTVSTGPRKWFYIARLQVADRRISEIEEVSYSPMATSKEDALFVAGFENLKAPDRIWDTVLPESERSTREQLFATVDRYFSAIGREIDPRTLAFHPECQRQENGAFTTNARVIAGSCRGSFVNVPSFEWKVVNRRFFIADEARGIAFAIGSFRATERNPQNNQSVVFEVIKVQDGLIRHIEAFFRPMHIRSGWGNDDR